MGELSLRSERFRTLWARQDVRHKSTGTSLLRHPQVGELDLSYEKLLSRLRATLHQVADFSKIEG